MLIKSADDCSKRVELLESLQRSQYLDARQKTWAREELMRVQRGISGERDAAHYLDNYLQDSRNYAVLHDLRLEMGDNVAQIDHILISRTYSFYLLETKNFNGNLRINDRGEFSVRYAGEKEFGIPSPLEQSRRHERLLTKALEMFGLTGRAGTKPTFHHVVLVAPKATITRPRNGVLDTSTVIKADQFRSWHEKHVAQDSSLLSAITGLANLRSSETVEQWGRLLSRLHRPSDYMRLPDFMAPKQAATEPARAPARQSVVAVAEESVSVKRKLICAKCGNKITYSEGKFCWGNERRFGGLQYCRQDQAAFQ